MIKNMYVTLMPVIFAGIFNMIFTKTSFYKNHCQPIDKGKKLSDNKRIFGDNKTFSGFMGMILFGGISQIMWGGLCNIFTSVENCNYMYVNNENNIIFNTISGIILGFAYAVFELPNSFIKRRIDIPSGKTVRGTKGIIFFIIDQIDSILGVSLSLCLFCDMTLKMYFMYIFLGGFTHITINIILYKLKIRKNL